MVAPTYVHVLGFVKKQRQRVEHSRNMVYCLLNNAYLPCSIYLVLNNING